MDKINSNTIRGGSVLKIHPAERSHILVPYQVIVVHVDLNGFKTKLLDPNKILCKNPHIGHFKYDAPEWDYHKNRFKIIEY